MAVGRGDQRKAFAEGYTKEQVEAVLKNCGLDIVSETYSDFLCFCPYHGNRDTPSFSVGVENGTWICFNPACGEKGNLLALVKYTTQRNDFEAMRFIQKKRSETEQSFEDRLEKAMEEPVGFEPWQPKTLERLRQGMLSHPDGIDYMKGRGFTKDTVDHFEVGFSQAAYMVTVPVHSPNGIPVGIVGRGIEGKVFKNSKGLPRNRTLFNLHRAKRQGDIVIVTESSFDAMRVHQAGFPNVIGTLGGSMSPENYALLDRHFSMIIIMTDMDDPKKHIYKNCRKCHPAMCRGHNPGRDLGLAIASTLRNKNIMWASHDYREVYPHGAKDAGDLTDDEITQCIHGAVSHIEYLQWLDLGLYV